MYSRLAGNDLEVLRLEAGVLVYILLNACNVLLDRVQFSLAYSFIACEGLKNAEEAFECVLDIGELDLQFSNVSQTILRGLELRVLEIEDEAGAEVVHCGQRGDANVQAECLRLG